jgi:TP901-1 family phage major tail protein
MARTQGVLNGTDLLIYVNSIVISYATTGKISFTADMRDTTNKDSGGWKSILPGLKSWGVEGSGFVTLGDIEPQIEDYNLSFLFGLIADKTRVTLKFKTANTADYYFQGYAYLTSVSADAPNEANTTYSMSFAGDGELHLYDPGGIHGPIT